ESPDQPAADHRDRHRGHCFVQLSGAEPRRTGQRCQSQADGRLCAALSQPGPERGLSQGDPPRFAGNPGHVGARHVARRRVRHRPGPARRRAFRLAAAKPFASAAQWFAGDSGTGLGGADGVGGGPRAQRRHPRPRLAHHRRARSAVRRSAGKHPAATGRGHPLAGRQSAARVLLRHLAEPCAATARLHAVSLGKQHPHGQRAGVCRRRRAGADALRQPQSVSGSPGQYGDSGDAGAGVSGRLVECLEPPALGQGL
ncbi:Phosphonate ABC transporter permease protein phnE1 (TC 3.A.1.9.1), partial [Pseudomonas fluorescens]